MTHQKPGFPLEATIEEQANGAIWIRITLPGGVETLTEGPKVPRANIGPLNVMYYPDQFVQILIPLGGMPPTPFMARLPISSLPPHKQP